MKTEGLFLKANKNGDEIGKDENLNMLTRKVDGEVCMDVECGPNKAVLYVSRLFGGSKKLCILYDEEWITPNEFQNVSGRRSAKDWKRSIRHNGVSLKTFMLSGVLSKPEEGSIPNGRGSTDTSLFIKATGKVQHKRKLKKKAKRKPRHSLRTVRPRSVTPESVTPDSVTADSVTPNSVTVEDVIGSDSDTQMAIEPCVDDPVKSEDADDLLDVLDDTKDESDVDEEQEEQIKDTVEATPSTKDLDPKPNDPVSQEITEEVCESLSDDVTDTLRETPPVIHLEPITDETNRDADHGGLDTNTTKRDIMDPYEVTVTPPPTPPSKDLKDHVTDHMTGVHVHSSCESNNATGVVSEGRRTIEYKPYLFNSRDQVNVREDSKQLASKGLVTLENGLDSRRSFNTDIDYNKGGNHDTNISRKDTVTSPTATSLPPFHMDPRLTSADSIARSPVKMRELTSENKRCTIYPSNTKSSHSPAGLTYPSITSPYHPFTPYGIVQRGGQTGSPTHIFHHPNGAHTGTHTGAHTGTSAQVHHHPNGIIHSACKCNTSLCSPERKLFATQYGGSGPNTSLGRAPNVSLSSSPRSSVGNSPRSSVGSSSGSSVGSSSGSSIRGSPSLSIDSSYKAQKRQHTELYDDKPLDLSMKKTKVRDHDDVTHTKSRDREHVIKGSFETRDKTIKTQQANMFAFAHPMATAKTKTNGAVYPFINPLNTLNTLNTLHFEHNAGHLNPCFCSLCVNPVSLYVPCVWDWTHAV